MSWVARTHRLYYRQKIAGDQYPESYGASAGNITGLLSKDLLEVVIVAGVISLPVVWYAASAWLDTFAFRIQLTWDIFIVPTVTLTVMCLLTVTTHILRGVHANPAKVLKSE